MDMANPSRVVTEFSQADSNSRAVELPKIGKSVREQPSLSARFEWLTKETEYGDLSAKEIDQEYQRLRKGLHALNAQAARIVSKFSSKVPRKATTAFPDQAWQMCEREKENNVAIIARLRYELEQLKGRASFVGTTSKFDLDDAIEEARAEIKRMRHSNKELEKKSKELGDKIHVGDAFFDEGNELELENIKMNRKLTKLQTRMEQNREGLRSIKKKIYDISSKSDQADAFLAGKNTESKQDKALEETYQNRMSKKEAIKHSMQSTSKVKQQKYHKLLKELEQATLRISKQQEAITAVQQMKERRDEEYRQYQVKVKQMQEVRSQRRSEAEQQDADIMFYTEIEPAKEVEAIKTVNNRYNRSNSKRGVGHNKTVHDKLQLSQNRTQPVRAKPVANSTAFAASIGTEADEKPKDKAKQPYLTLDQKNYPTRRSLQARKENNSKEKADEKLFKTALQSQEAQPPPQKTKRNRRVFEGRNSFKVPQLNTVEKAQTSKNKKTDDVTPAPVTQKASSKKIQRTVNRQEQSKKEEAKPDFQVAGKQHKKDKQAEDKKETPVKEAGSESEDSYDFEEQIKKSRESWASSRLKIDIQLGEIGQNIKKRESALNEAPQVKTLSDEVIEEDYY